MHIVHAPCRLRRNALFCLAASLSLANAAAADSSPAVPPNTDPGIIVMSPVPDGGPDHFRLAGAFMVTGNLPPGSRLLATATLPSGEVVVLRDFVPEACSIHYTFPDDWQPASARSLAEDSCTPTSYPLTGFGLPTASLPFGSAVDVKVLPIRRSGDLKAFQVRSTDTVSGIRQSADRALITITGNFAGNTVAYVYFGLWPVPVKPEAVTVRPERIVIDLQKDPKARRCVSGFYPITVYQPGAVCDTVLLRLQSLVDAK